MFVTFEGVDGSGKSTQATLLAEWLTASGHDVLLTREPGGTPVGEAVRALLLHGDDLDGWTEAMLFAAARAEHVARAIRPALAAGRHVICDRYLDSSVAYQGIARGLGREGVRDLSLTATGGLLPERTFLLLVEPEAARRRGDDGPDRIEQEAGGFMQRVDAGYRLLAADEPERIVPLDGALPPAEIEEAIREHVRRLL